MLNRALVDDIDFVVIIGIGKKTSRDLRRAVLRRNDLMPASGPPAYPKVVEAPGSPT
jgi:hypothetical protein